MCPSAQKYPHLLADCVGCLALPCQSSIQTGDPRWESCIDCLRKGYPLQCTSSGSYTSCANALIGLYSTFPYNASCCSNITASMLQGLQQDIIAPRCNAPPSPSTSRPQIAAAPLPYTSSGQPLQYIMPQMNFSCHGCLQSLNITLMAGVSADSSFYFQLWRRYTAINSQTSLTKELYQLNTSVDLTIRAATFSSSNVVYSLPLNVCFHEGDTIGIQLPSNSLLRIATDNSSLIYKREIPAQCSDVVSGIFQPSDNYTGSPLVTPIMAPSSPVLVPTTTLSLLTSVYKSTAASTSYVQSTVLPSQTVGAVSFTTALPHLPIAPISATVGVVVVFAAILLFSLILVLVLRHLQAKSGDSDSIYNQGTHMPCIFFNSFPAPFILTVRFSSRAYGRCHTTINPTSRTCKNEPSPNPPQ